MVAEQHSSTSSSQPGKRPGGIQSVQRALSLLDVVCRAGRPIGLAEASEMVGLAKPTAFRMLQTLADYGLLRQDAETKCYTAGLYLFELYNTVVSQLDPLLEAQPLLARLSAKYDETVHLAILDHADIVYIAKEESKRAVRMFSAIGKRAPAYCTGVGKALLAFADSTDVAAAISGRPLVRHTAHTITTVPELEHELAEIRARGYSLDNGEHEDEIRCVASPVLNTAGRAVAGISLTMPVSRFSAESIPRLAEDVTHYANEISKQLGFNPPRLIKTIMADRHTPEIRRHVPLGEEPTLEETK